MRTLERSVMLLPLVALAAVLIGLPSVAFSRDDDARFTTRLIGINETPSINSDGTGTLRLTLNADSIDFTLTYSNVSGNPIQSHIHFGQARTAGGVVLFFCGPVPPAQQACPAATSGTVSGRLTAADVRPVPTQGIKAGDLASVMRAIRQGAAYANIHTSNFPGGEIRGQITRVD